MQQTIHCLFSFPAGGLRASFVLADSEGLIQELFPPRAGETWTVIGLACQCLLAIGMLALVSGGQRGSGRPRRGIAIAALCASLGLLAYAIVISDLVFIAGQIVSALVFARIAAREGLGSTPSPSQRDEPGLRFPNVAPDSAERKLESIQRQPN